MFLIQLYFLLHFILMHYKCPLEMYVSSGTCHGHCVRICECGWTPPAERRENPILVHWQHLSRGEQQICPGQPCAGQPISWRKLFMPEVKSLVFCWRMFVIHDIHKRCCQIRDYSVTNICRS